MSGVWITFFPSDMFNSWRSEHAKSLTIANTAEWHMTSDPSEVMIDKSFVFSSFHNNCSNGLVASNSPFPSKSVQNFCFRQMWVALHVLSSCSVLNSLRGSPESGPELVGLPIFLFVLTSLAAFRFLDDQFHVSVHLSLEYLVDLALIESLYFTLKQLLLVKSLSKILKN